MYGLDADVDLGFLVGAELLQVAIGLHEIQFNFDWERSLCVESEFVVIDRGSRAEFKAAPQGAAAAVSLLGRKIVSESHTTSGDLRLDFENDGGIELTDGSTHYESYQIRNGRDLYVV